MGRQGLTMGKVLLRRPRLVPAAVRLRRRPRTAASVAPAPVPAAAGDRDWLAFRMELAYGDAGAVPPAEDLADYLQWAREMRMLRGTWRQVPRGGAPR